MSEHPLALQIALVGAVPAIYGAITGYFLGISETVYLVLSVLGVVGGVAAGFDHVGTKAGALRGVAAGLIFGGFILIAYELHGEDAKADLPQPAILLIVVTTILAVAFASVGGWARARAEQKAATHSAPDVPGPLG